MILALMLFFFMLVFSACNLLDLELNEHSYYDNENGSEPITTIIPAVTPAPTPAPPPRTTITFNGFSRHNQANRELVSIFNSISERVYVEYIEFTSYEHALTRIEAIIAGGDPFFDVIDINAMWVASMVYSGVLEPLNDRMERDFISFDGMQRELQSAALSGGIFWAMPRGFTIGVLAMSENATTFAPSSWDALISQSAGFREAGWDFGYTSSLGHFEETFRYMLEFIYGNGGRMFDANGDFSIVNPGAISGLNQLREAAFAGGLPANIAAFSGTNAQSAFFDGRSAFLRADSDIWALGDFIGITDDIRFSIAPLPFSSNFPIMDGYLTAISASSQNKDAAWEFLQFLISEQAQIIHATNGQIPAYMPLMTNRDVLQANPHFSLSNFQQLASNARVGANTPNFREYLHIIQIEFGHFMQGNRTAREFVEEVQRAIDIISEASY